MRSTERAGNGNLSCAGSFEGEMKVTSGRSLILKKINVFEGLKDALLGRTEIHFLNLLNLFDEVSQVFECTLVEEATEFKSLFLDTPGLITSWSHPIILVIDAKPFAMSASHKVPLLLFEKVQKELLCMEHNGIISNYGQEKTTRLQILLGRAWEQSSITKKLKAPKPFYFSLSFHKWKDVIELNTTDVY